MTLRKCIPVWMTFTTRSLWSPNKNWEVKFGWFNSTTLKTNPFCRHGTNFSWPFPHPPGSREFLAARTSCLGKVVESNTPKNRLKYIPLLYSPLKRSQQVLQFIPENRAPNCHPKRKGFIFQPWNFRGKSSPPDVLWNGEHLPPWIVLLGPNTFTNEEFRSNSLWLEWIKWKHIS